MSFLKTVTIAKRPGFREGVTMKFAGQLLESMNAEQTKLFLDGEFEPEPVTEAVDIELEIPPLSFQLLKALKPQIDRLTNNQDLDSFREALVEVLAYALSRNYRGVPLWLIERNVDVANMTDIAQAVMDVSGLKRKEEVEKKAKAAEPNGSGTTSTST